MSLGKLLGKITGANSAAKAAERAGAAAGQAAVAQQTEAKRQFDLINRAGENLQRDVMGAANQYSVQELNALSQGLEVQQRNIAQQEKLMASIDPTLMEASQQALRLLRGERVDSLTGANSARTQQRQQLQNSLRAQGLGDGSSAALNALQKFDLGTAQMEQQQLQTLLGTTLNSRVDLGASAGQLANIGGGFGAIGARNAALLGNVGTTRLGALSGAGQQLIANAGAQFTGTVLQNQARAQYLQNQANQVAGLIGMGIGGLVGGPAGAAMGGKAMAGQSYGNMGNIA
jgi:hypothetical protein